MWVATNKEASSNATIARESQEAILALNQLISLERLFFPLFISEVI